MNDSVESWDWSEWLPFPDPRNRGILKSPIGPGLYQLMNSETGEYVLFGKGKNLAYRMTSIIPSPYGQGTRNNINKKEYVFNNIDVIRYRTLALKNNLELKTMELKLKNSQDYIFNS